MPIELFSRYRLAAAVPLGKPSQGDASCRHGYGLPVIKECGTSCVYCGRDLAGRYEDWLDLSVDHVIPVNTPWACRPWLEDIANLVTCCRACNEFLNQFKCSSPEPASFGEFASIRDAAFLSKREQVLRRHQREREWYERWRKPGVNALAAS